MSLLTKQNQTSVAAGGSSPNVLTGSRFEYLPAYGLLNVYATASQAGLTARVKVNGTEILEQSTVNTNNRDPLFPDDILLGEVPVDAGDKIEVLFSNSAGTATLAFWKAELNEDPQRM